MFRTTYSQDLVDCREDAPSTARQEIGAVARSEKPHVSVSGIYTGYVMHRRAAPKSHTFNHAFYFYALDLDRLEETARHVRGFGYNRVRPVAIHDKDYIDNSPGPVKAKLVKWLRDNGYAADFHRVKLITSPRFLNYAFNPVSFYLCYTEQGQLQTVVAEVNNTFRERHLYVVEQLSYENDRWAPASRSRKSFHVSPFNAMEGEYAFHVADTDTELRITVDIIKDGKAVFFTELYGEPDALTTRTLWKTIIRQPFRPLLTFPRIVWEAGRLYVRKRLKVFSKPVPRSTATISTAKPSMIQKWAVKAVLSFLSRISSGQLALILPNGEKHILGVPDDVMGVIRVRDYRFFTDLLLRGSTGLGEAYVKEYWQSDDPAAALLPMARSLDGLKSADGPASFFSRIIDSLSHRKRSNSKPNSRKNIQDHYDLGNDFYETFLDPTLTYSAAVFGDETIPLEQAQLNKLDAIIRKADIHEDHHILEIGSGWGSFAIRAARTTGCRVTTITLSKEQHRLAEERIKAAGLSDKIDVRICDYRDIEGSYDRIVSIEMLEAVGHEYMPGYFTNCRRLLKPGGRLVLQVITIPNDRYDEYCRSCDWIQKYIFPGGHLPSVEAIEGVIGKTSTFHIEDQENIGLHYATTLRLWRERFLENLHRVRELGYDDTFIRKWEYYLGYCEAGFAAGSIHTQHLVLIPDAAKK